MSWINDVRHDLAVLDLSRKSLRNFGLTIGSIFIVIAVYLWYQGISANMQILLPITGILLISGGFIFPVYLKPVYRVWMAFAIALGWLVSRIILTFIFFIVLTPVSFLAKLAGKDFLDRKNLRNSYWIRKEEKQTNYEKMS